MSTDTLAADAQRAIDQAEWENDDNWSHPVFGVYFSKRDSRVWVPKRYPSFGWTVNLGRPAGTAWLVALLALPWLLAAGRKRR